MSSIISSKIMDSSDATTITTTGDNSVGQKIRTSSFDSCLIIRDNSEKPDFLKVSLVIGSNIKIGLNRLCNEKISACLNRLKKNILKVYQKKMKILLKQAKQKKEEGRNSNNQIDGDIYFIPNDVKLKLIYNENEFTNQIDLTNKEAFNKAYRLMITIVKDEDDGSKNIIYNRDIVVNPREIVSIHSHKFPMINFPLYPSVILNGNTTKRCNCKFKWERILINDNNDSETNKIILSTNLKYIPVDEDLNHQLLFSCTTSTSFYNVEGQCVELVQSEDCIFDKICAMPLHFISPMRYGKLMNDSNSKRKNDQHETLSSCYRIMTYNILHEKFEVKKEDICADEYLNIEYRQQIIAMEITKSNADIICLQECSYPVFKYLSLYLSDSDIYDEGNFIQKKNGSDGCAMFFNVHKFRKYNYQYIYMSDHYANFDYDKLKAIVDKNDFDKLKQLPQVAQFLCLKPKNNNVAENDEITNKMVLASNTHLTYLPNLENLRDLQCDIILKHANQIINIEQKKGQLVTYIFAGDLNSTIETGIIKYLSHGNINVQHDDFVIATSMSSNDNTVDAESIISKDNDIYHSFVMNNKWNIKDELILLHAKYGNQWNIIRLELVSALAIKYNEGEENDEIALFLKYITNANIKHYCLLFDEENVSTRASGIHIKMGNLSIQWDVESKTDTTSSEVGESIIRNTDGIINESLLKHDFDFLPCYNFNKKVKPHLSIPITVWTHTFRGTLDYIFFHNVKHFNLLPATLIDTAINDNKFCMPNRFYPSDHISIVCEFELY